MEGAEDSCTWFCKFIINVVLCSPKLYGTVNLTYELAELLGPKP